MRYVFGAMTMLVLFGCGGAPRLTYDKNWEVSDAGDLILLDPVKAEQKIKADVTTAGGGKVDIFIYLTKNQDAAEKAILTKKTTGGPILASKEGTDNATLNATIPPNEGTTISVRSSSLKKASTKLKVTN